jgi:hypothetical protein
MRAREVLEEVAGGLETERGGGVLGLLGERDLRLEP